MRLLKRNKKSFCIIYKGTGFKELILGVLHIIIAAPALASVEAQKQEISHWEYGPVFETKSIVNSLVSTEGRCNLKTGAEK